jgi:hypothetical protein
MILEFINNVGFPFLSVLGGLGTIASVSIFAWEVTSGEKKDWVFLWGPIVFWIVLLGGWALANILYGSFAP